MEIYRTERSLLKGEDRRCTYSVTMRRIRGTRLIVAYYSAKAVSITCNECVCVCV